MEDEFNIDLELDGRQYSFSVKLAKSGYSFKFHVLIDGIDVVYEPDEERNYRAILNESDSASIKRNTVVLIKAVGEKIESIR